MGRKKKKRGPGRPKGSKTKAKRGRPPKLAAKRRGRPPKAKRGRPKGSKAKKTQATPKAKRGRPVAKKNAFEQQLLASVGALVVSVEKLVTIQLNRIPNIKPATAATTRIQGAQVSTSPAEGPVGALDA